jgi:hypothetical protein
MNGHFGELINHPHFVEVGPHIINVDHIVRIDKSPSGRAIVYFSDGQKIHLPLDEFQQLEGLLNEVGPIRRY